MTKNQTAAKALNLGTFIDRHTFRYERDYPHPRERIFEALTKSEHWDAWFVPKSRVDARLGGRFHFTFGREFDDPWSWAGTIAEFDPPSVVDYAFDKGGGMRFELQTIEAGTRLYLTHIMPQGFIWADGKEDQPGGDEPGGANAPWRPGGMAGFLIALLDLDAYIADGGKTEDQRAMFMRRRRTIPGADWRPLTNAYREHIVETIPGGVQHDD